MNRTVLLLVLGVLTACGGPKTGTLHPHLAFTIPAEAGLTAARDFSVDRSGNVFVFSYDDYWIFKFSPEGEVLARFGGPREDERGFDHLMNIRALGDTLLAVDAGSISVFDLSGTLLARTNFSDTITCDLPRIDASGDWAGEWIVEESAEKVLTTRDALGGERSRVVGHELSEFFQGVEPGGFFFINPTQDRSYLYDFLPSGGLVWAASDELTVRVGDGPMNSLLFEAPALPLPFPKAEAEAMRARQANLSPPLYMNVPETYQLIQHLLVDESGDLWLFVMTQERTGFLHLSEGGRELGFYSLTAGFDPLSARVTAALGRLYFLVAEGEDTEIHVVERP